MKKQSIVVRCLLAILLFGASAPLWVNDEYPIVALWLVASWVAGVFIEGYACIICSRLVHFQKWHAELINEGKIRSFDVIRVLAFMLVVLGHMFFCLSVPSLKWVKSFSLGKMGVVLFVVLSGTCLSIKSLPCARDWWSFFKKRLATILPAYWVAYFCSVLLLFWWGNRMVFGLEPGKVLQTISGMDGYLRFHFKNYHLVGDWYVGFVILLYAMAPFLFRITKRWPVWTLLLSFGVEILAMQFTPWLSEHLIIWNKWPGMNLVGHFFEFVVGIVWIVCLRPSVKMYLMTTAVAILYLAGYFTLGKPVFCHLTWDGVLANVSLFVVLTVLFDLALVSGGAIGRIFGRLSQLTFLAFLYHHWLLLRLFSGQVIKDESRFWYSYALALAVSYGLAYLSQGLVAFIKDSFFPQGRDVNGVCNERKN